VTAEKVYSSHKNFMDEDGKKPNEHTEASQYKQATAHMVSKTSEFRGIFKATKHCSPFFSQQNF